MVRKSSKELINNEFYEELGERWYHADDDPVALLRAEGKIKHAWIKEQLSAYQIMPAKSVGVTNAPSGPKILDIACGAGFLANDLSLAGYDVSGLDASLESLKVASKYDSTQKVKYVQGDAYVLPFAESTFDVVCMMDFLEHVSEPKKVILEAARVLKSNGLFIYHTFSRNLIARLLVIIAIEKLVKNTPKHMHVYELFLNPKEVEQMCKESGLVVEVLSGIRPKIFTRAVWNLLRTGTVSPDFGFAMTQSTLVSYIGIARKV